MTPTVKEHLPDPQKLIERYRRAKERRSPWEGHWRKRQAPKPEPLKLDGDIGPKTEGAFASALADHGAVKLTKRYADDLGFGFG